MTDDAKLHPPMFPPNPPHPARRPLVEREPPPFSPASLFNEFNRSQLPPTEWKRLRVALTQAEFEAYRDWWLENKANFVHSIHGLPIVIEDHPMNPKFVLEYKE